MDVDEDDEIMEVKRNKVTTGPANELIALAGMQDENTTDNGNYDGANGNDVKPSIASLGSVTFHPCNDEEDDEMM